MVRFSTLLTVVSVVAVTCSAFIGNMALNRPLQCNSFGKRFAPMRTTELAYSDALDAESVDLRTLYPSLAPHANGTIAVDDTHTLFYQQYGQQSTNEKALTALFLHGGPGTGCSPNHARFMDPAKYRIVLLDQRGSGQSTPLGEVQRNTLQYLVQDCETLRAALGIDRWDLVLGGSWGSTLALAYAQTFPASVRSLVFRGVCLLRPCEVDWLVSSNGGAASLDPEGWTEFSSAVGVKPEDMMLNDRATLHAYYDRLMGDDPIARRKAARSWMRWETRVSSLARRYAQIDETPSHHPVLVWESNAGWSCQDHQGVRLHDTEWHESHMLRRGVSLGSEPLETITHARLVSPVHVEPSNNDVSPSEAAKYIPAQPMLTCFYSVNERYATDNVNLLDIDRMERVRSIPCIAIQGGKDTICPPDTALDLLAAWPEMELRIPKGSGHSMYDPAITNELVRATDHFAEQFSA